MNYDSQHTVSHPSESNSPANNLAPKYHKEPLTLQIPDDNTKENDKTNQPLTGTYKQQQGRCIF